MLNLARVLWRILRLTLHLFTGMAVVAWRFPAWSVQQRADYVRAWSLGTLRVAGLGFSVQGQPRGHGTLLIANHVSWLDIPALHAACPEARFVAKADMLRWPLLGWLARSIGTVFIERERKRDAMRVVHHVAETLQQGGTVAVFPEGTTGPGPEMLPVHANLLQAAIAVEAPIQPAVLRFYSPTERFATAAQFIGDTTLLQSVWRVLSARGLNVEVVVLPAQATAHADRRALAAHLHQEMQAVLDRA